MRRKHCGKFTDWFLISLFSFFSTSKEMAPIAGVSHWLKLPGRWVCQFLILLTFYHSMVQVLVPGKATDAKAEKGNSRGREKHYFFRSSTNPVCLHQESALWWLTWNSMEGFVLTPTGFGVLNPDRAEEANSTRHCEKPGTTLAAFSAEGFSCCDTVWLWWHLLPTSAKLLTHPQRVPTPPWEEFSLVLIEIRDGEKQAM